MIVRRSKKFEKDCKALANQQAVIRSVELVIQECERAEDLSEIKNLVKLKGYDNLYRIRMGNYRIVLGSEEEHLVFLRVGHRKDIYRNNPPT